MIPKFRCFVNNKKMFDVESIDFTEKQVEVPIFDKETGEYLASAGFSFDDILLMQSTGLVDKNGVEVFEGDAIRTGGNTYEVKFGSQRFINFTGVGFYLVKHYSEFFVKEQLMLDGSKYEVIGNIYENPELVE